MKHLLLSAVALMGMAFTMSGCSSDEEKTNTLNGTVWVGEKNGTHTIKFAEKTFPYDYVYQDGNYKGHDKNSGTYEYQPPVVRLTSLDKETNKMVTNSAKIEGDKLTGDGFVLHRQK